MQNLEEIYGAKSTTKSLDDYKKKLLNTNTNLNPIYKQSSKPENWIGYESSSEGERLDSDSEIEKEKESYIDKIANSVVIDSNTRKVKQKEFVSSNDITWLGVKPTHLESHSLAPLQNNKTVYRDSKGAVVDPDQQKPPNPNEERLKLWAGGEVQRQAKETLKDLIQSEKSKPFARHTIDPEYDLELKKRPRFGDPLSSFNEPVNKKYKFSWENRYSINPGKMWDGVDRTNGFEQRWLAKQGKKVWENSMAYKNFASEL
jgi:Pre-mRNA-splicing factor of RES complex